LTFGDRIEGKKVFDVSSSKMGKAILTAKKKMENFFYSNSGANSSITESAATRLGTTGVVGGL
jgi:hypothetical protein